ncbi:uncharacterized protein [Asterias amurensis]|uniref:uncharacterized protein n=1 Tax=Asterias amurensis TaxID=7602 RepID=UPI003AB2B000
MAAPMDHHRRQKSCDVRPAYREGRRERAVKVYTINQESRYLLVQGVPAINVTDELLKRMSLYGTIEEYKILEEYPAEAFTKVYWVKYANIQAARMCKRKLDDQPFYGGTLHLCYAPEYESVEDTRLKLQERRKDVARRLRKLQPGGNADVPHTVGQDHSSSSSTQDNAPIASKSDTPAPTYLDSSKSQHIGPRKPDSTIAKPPNTSTDSSAAVKQEVPLHLPAPPKVLPAWEWEKPLTSHDQFPRLPTAHATLPLNYNPYPDDYKPHDVEASQEGASHRNATSEINPPLRSNILKDSTADTSGLNFLKTGARPKFKLKQDRRRVGEARPNQPTFLERVAWREGAVSEPEAGTRPDVSDDRRAQLAHLKRPYQNQFPIPSTSDQVPPNAELTSSLIRHPLVKRKHPADCPQPFLVAETRFQGELQMPQSEQWKEGGFGVLPRMDLPPTMPTMSESSFDRMVHNFPQQQRNPTQGPGINAFNNGEYTAPMRTPRPAAVAAAAAAVAAAAAIAAAADGEPDSKRRRI